MVDPSGVEPESLPCKGSILAVELWARSWGILLSIKYFLTFSGLTSIIKIKFLGGDPSAGTPTDTL